jgi:hypothetical protein
MKNEKDPVQEKLDQTATLINDLQQTQNERLSQNIPPHISQVPGPSEKEIQLGKINIELFINGMLFKMHKVQKDSSSS